MTTRNADIVTRTFGGSEAEAVTDGEELAVALTVALALPVPVREGLVLTEGESDGERDLD